LHAGESVSYEVVDETFGDNAQTTIRFVIPEGTDTVEVLGTTVVPEFQAVLPLDLSIRFIRERCDIFLLDYVCVL